MKENRKPANRPAVKIWELAGIWSSARAKNKNASKGMKLLSIKRHKFSFKIPLFSLCPRLKALDLLGI